MASLKWCDQRDRSSGEGTVQHSMHRSAPSSRRLVSALEVDPPRDGEGFNHSLDHQGAHGLFDCNRVQAMQNDRTQRREATLQSSLCHGRSRHNWRRTRRAAVGVERSILVLACECSHVRLRQRPAFTQMWRTTWQIGSARSLTPKLSTAQEGTVVIEPLHPLPRGKTLS